jgi:hypothetical protein
MSGIENGQRPSPAMMPRRRPVIPPAQRSPAMSAFKVATGIPRRGIQGAVVWPDTGVLLGLGTGKDLLDRFRLHYTGRIRIAKTVEAELRFRSNRDTSGLSDDEYDRVSAATAAINALLVGPDRFLPIGVGNEDLPEVARIVQQLKAISEDKNKRHGGEAEIIVLAAKQARTGGCVHMLLTNDGGASIVAEQHRLQSRHVGDVLAEFACGTPPLAPEACYTAFTAAVRLSAPPSHSRQSQVEDFTCVMTLSGCADCDGLPQIS